MVIAIGHGAYRGSNSLSYAKTKTAAVRELRRRGVRRDDARRAVNESAERDFGYAVCRVATGYKDSLGFDVGACIEVCCRSDINPLWSARQDIVHC